MLARFDPITQPIAPMMIRRAISPRGASANNQKEGQNLSRTEGFCSVHVASSRAGVRVCTFVRELCVPRPWKLSGVFATFRPLRGGGGVKTAASRAFVFVRNKFLHRVIATNSALPTGARYISAGRASRTFTLHTSFNQ